MSRQGFDHCSFLGLKIAIQATLKLPWQAPVAGLSWRGKNVSVEGGYTLPETNIYKAPRK